MRRIFHFRAQNGPFILNKFFLAQAIIITFIHQLALFIVQSLKKFLQQIQSYENASFLGPKWSICPPSPLSPNKKNFFQKIINIIFIKLLAPFVVQNFEKFFQSIQSYDDVQFLDPKWLIFPNENFFRKPVNEPCFCHSCLSTCQKTKSEINLLMKY